MGSAHPHGVSMAPTPHPTLSREPPQESTLGISPELLFLLDRKADAQGVICPAGPVSRCPSGLRMKVQAWGPAALGAFQPSCPPTPFTPALLDRGAVCDSMHICLSVGWDASFAACGPGQHPHPSSCDLNEPRLCLLICGVELRM